MLSSGQLFLKRHIWLISQCFIFPPLLFSSQWNRLIWAWHEVTSEQLPTLCIFFLFNPFSIFSWDYYCKNLLWPCFCSGPKNEKLVPSCHRRGVYKVLLSVAKSSRTMSPSWSWGIVTISLACLREAKWTPLLEVSSEMQTLHRIYSFTYSTNFVSGQLRILPLDTDFLGHQ